MQGTKGRAARAVVAGLAFLVVAAPAHAQGGDALRNHLYDKFQVGLAFTTVLNRSDARVDGPNGEIGTRVNFKDMLGITEATVQPAIGLRWKPGRKTEFDLGYQFLNQTGQRTIDRNLVIGGDTVYLGLDANTDLSASNATFQFKYSIWAKEKHNIGLALGLGAIFFDLQLDAVGDASGGGGSAADTVNIDKSFTGPTASIGAFGNWRLSDRWYIGADARGVGARVDRYDFSVFEGNAGAQYYFSDTWGAALGFFYTDVTVDVAAKSDGSVAGDLIGKVKYAYSSLRLGVIAAF